MAVHLPASNASKRPLSVSVALQECYFQVQTASIPVRIAITTTVPSRLAQLAGEVALLAPTPPIALPVQPLQQLH